jgi:hypothetical protein
MRPFLINNLRARALFGTPIRALRTVWSFLSPRVSRIGLMADELDRQLFGRATLNQLPPWILINATNLRTGKGWKFFHDRAGDYLIGATDRTSEIRIAEAVAASAAYPGLTDSFGFVTRWEDLRGDLLDEARWERPPQPRPGAISRWRERYGKPAGRVTIPLADGGLYDNEGMNGLRGRKVTHAILSAVGPPESDHASGFGFGRLLRVVGVIHDRLGAATRQLAHEMTHGTHPTEVATELEAMATELRAISGENVLPIPVGERLQVLANRASKIASVGTPPRGPQFTASAQILLHRSDLARNAFAVAHRGGFDVPAEYRGLEPTLVEELSRVRTDLDALEPEVLDLLIAQGYFLTDFLCKLSMPGLVFGEDGDADWYTKERAPRWNAAHAAIEAANANRAAVVTRLVYAGKRIGVLGRVPRRGQRWWYRLMLSIAAAPVFVLVLTALLCLVLGVGQLLKWLGLFG